ncbi:MAG: vanadium-dependent haloperoxidase [Cyclobacteriaceae bacterium]
MRLKSLFKKSLILCIGAWYFSSCSDGSGSAEKQLPYQKIDLPTELYHQTVKRLTDVIVYDIFSPPVASRIYVYPNIAAYEVLAKGNSNYKSLSDQLNGLDPIPLLKDTLRTDLEIASLKAFLVTGKALVFSENRIDEFEEELNNRYLELGVPEDVVQNSIAYGQLVADHILAWADKDNYKQTRTFPKYTIQEDDYSWKPTPPDYMEGIEPSWNNIRTLVLDSAGQFVPDKPTPFSLEKESQFYKELMQVYNIGKSLDEEQTAIAQFWDCNPYVSHHKGHAMFATKKITPGGHWIGITNIVTQKAKSNYMETVNAYTRVSIALFDAFISCWDEKWRSVLIRPETLINKLIDENWVPLLQTPPFPEYTSGHSVISTAAAATLTDLYGSNFAYTDSTEVEYGLKPRDFTSFFNASEEAAISRLYGGIHYMPAIANGVEQGKKIGIYINKNLITKQ